MFKQLTTTSLVVLGLTACGGSSNSTPTQPNTPPEAEPSAFSAVRTAARNEMQSNESAAVSIAIYQDGKVVFAEAFGNKQLGGNGAVTSNTLFQIGSTTKMFTSLATMQLVERGMVNVDDKLTNLLPNTQFLSEQSQGWNDVNVHHLMTHQGGFTDDYETISESSELSKFMQEQYGMANPQMVEPGHFFNYSNPNFSYLGTIVEQVSQQDYRDFMTQSVFEPLGMNRTTMQKTELVADNDFALGVYQDDNNNATGYTNLNQVNDWAPVIPAGIFTWSTPTEVLKMADFLLEGNDDVLSDPLRANITTAHTSIDVRGLPMNYGYGIFVDDGFIYQSNWYPEKLWQHSGNTAGYTSKFWVLPEKNVAVAILSSGNGDDYANTMIEAIKSVTELPNPQAIPFASVDPTSFEQHVGTYDAGFITIEITHNNGQLGVNIPELNQEGVAYSRILTPLGGNTFLANQASENVEVTFFSNEANGESLYIRNRDFVGIKVGQEQSLKPKQARKFPESNAASKIVLY